jgi:phospholipid transport system substrate-binding protein
MRRSSPNLLHFWLLLASLCLLVPAPIHDAAANTASPQDPQPLISERISALLTRLRDNSAAIHKDPNVAYQISDEMIAPYIDFPRITRLVIGKYWNDASGAQREQLTEEISSLLTRSYVTAMTSYIDELTREDNMIEFLPSRYQPGDVKASVRANIALGGRAPAAVQYQLYYVD